MALIAKNDLKKVFVGISTIYASKNGISIADNGTIVPDFELPVTLDTFKYTQAEASLTHIKIHGMNTDWAVTSTPGDVTISMTLPTVDDDLLSYFFGTGVKISTFSVNGVAYDGNSYEQNAVKVTLGLAIMNDAKDTLFVIGKASFFASLDFENGSTTPIGIKLSGSIEASDGSNKNIAILTKKAS